MWNVIEAYQAKMINLLRMGKDWEMFYSVHLRVMLYLFKKQEYYQE